ncbi:hypothetical protein MN116_007258 [Schistosoma mekongi]|uniref:Eukaryotic translation initiation factor 5B n=1 Tax=Schistosoma mekongi TaxID=38744 RepID=A0AAE2D4B5_SCHME|nr:hypothetical protein MN116_007258 [Schistosoma mekongi]
MSEKVEEVVINKIIGDGKKDTVASQTKKKDKKKPTKDQKQTKDEIKEKKMSKHVAKIKEDLARQREEEERLKREQEEEFQRLEKERLEEEALIAREKELKLKKKLKEKERKQRLKEEGKLLTDKQKEDRRKVMELLQARGIGIPDDKPEVKKRPQYGKLKKRITQVKKEEDIAETREVEAENLEVSSEELSCWEMLADTHLKSPSEESSEETEDYLIIDQKPSHSDQVETSVAYDDDLPEEEKARLIELAKIRIKERHEMCESERSEFNLRAGVVCVLGHVDTGKTKILDKLRNTHVQDREAGGITQQIGATNVPLENIVAATQMCPYLNPSELRIPGLLIIDTPGHESFSNLRVRGSSLCDIAILVVDLMHGLEEQTKESIKILRSRKTPFIVALNKVDRLYKWKPDPETCIEEVVKSQDPITQNDLEDHLKKVFQDFAMMELNVELFYKNAKPEEFISMVPTSAHTGDGMGDLLSCLCLRLQNKFSKRLAYTEELSASVMEVKEIHGLGTTIDVIVVNGRLHEGDTIVLAGQEGPICTQIRGILQPAPMSELRVKGTYNHLKEVVGAQGVKLIAKDLEKALAGLPLFVANGLSEELYYKEEVCHGLKHALKAISVSPLGVYVVASTLGSLESLLVYLKSVDIPYSGINIGTVHKKDVMKASVMCEREPKWAVILAFDVRVDKDAQKLATQLNVKIFTSEIIYRLQTQMEKYMEDLKTGNQRKHRDLAVFPCKLRILPEMIFNKRAPIVVGVRVEAGVVRVGTPICVPSRECVHLGRIFSIENNHKPMEEARTGMEVCVRIDPTDGETPKLYGRHFDLNDLLVSKISRESIDVMKEYFRSDLKKEDWKLMIELKEALDIS